ncbi:serine/threonine-protein kinase [Streptomyces guryensis]|uniref:non-specific serine/threonine protein kinase n=1 Tax=Streptomyces guryensis TaxID=2886947 RepID=A0A9Q3VZP4_9ACTN|nr:serine/threonine-protein kinase [Streptomyces guryensis]MCD9881107.1 serine/threonine protein kinase [Streptomyces guryensis]
MGDVQVLAGRYRLERFLGQGGMGRVYEAWDTALDRSVAVKLLSGWAAESPSAVDRFRREAQAAARISSRNAVVVYDVGVEGGQPYLVMERLDGVPLNRILRASAGPLPDDVVRAVVWGMCAGLAAAHQVGIVHRDVKPGNVFLCRDGRVVLVDFGIARLIESGMLPQADMFVGTPVYMAPEAVRGLTVGPQADLYGLGCVMYRMLSGEEPFTGGDDSTNEIFFAKVNQPPPTLRGRWDVDAELAGIVDRLLEREPHLRPSAADEIAVYLSTPERVEDVVSDLVAGHLRESATEWARTTPEPATATTLHLLAQPRRPESTFGPPPSPSSPVASEDATASILVAPHFDEYDDDASLRNLTHRLMREGLSPEAVEAKHREAVNMVSRGKYSEALKEHGFLILQRTADLGENHPVTLVNHFWAAVCLARLGVAPEALNRLSMINDACSPGHPGV